MVPTPPARAAPDPAQCEHTTEDLYARRLYDEAADLALACWDAAKDPLFLFRAAKYWKRAGRHARAIHAFRAYLEIAVQDNPRRRSDARAVLADELAYTGQVVLGVVPPLAGDERITITAAPRPAETFPAPPLEYTFTAGDFAEVNLDPGVWDLTISRGNFNSYSQSITIPHDRSPQTINISMVTTDPPPEAEPTPPPEAKPTQPQPELTPQPQPTPQRTSPEGPSPPPQPRPQTALKLGGAVAVGGGGLLLALATGYAASVGQAERRYIDLCEAQRDESGCYESYRYGKRLNVIQTAGFTAGALLMGAGIAMLAISAHRKRARSPHGFALFHMRGGLGFRLERRF